MNRPIVFLHPWRGREPGQEDSQLDAPITEILVQRQLARYLDAPPATNAQTSAPTGKPAKKGKK